MLLRGQSVSGEGSLAQFIMNRDVRSAWRRERSEVRRIINYYCEHVHLYNLQILYLTRSTAGLVNEHPNLKT